MKFMAILAAILTTNLSQASLRDLSQEYLKSNIDILKSQTSSQQSKMDYEALSAAKTWGLSWSENYSDSTLENSPFSTFSYNNLKTKVHSLGISKDFEWGGSLSLANSLSQTNYNSSSSDIYNFQQSITYSQDLWKNFFGREFYNSKDTLQSAEKLSGLGYEESIESGLLSLAKAFFGARLNKTLVRLQEEGKDRAIKRLKLIKKRVKDGLREKVDLYQAEMAVHGQDELIKSAQMDLETSLESLSNLLHRPVLASEIEVYSMEKLEMASMPRGNMKNNKALLSLSEKQNMYKLALESKDYALYPNLNFSATMTNNDYDNNSSTTLSKGTLGNDHDELALALTMTWTIGSGPQKIEKAKSRLDYLTAVKEVEKMKINFSKMEDTLKKQVRLLEKNILSVQKRVTLASRALGEYNKLYRRGRADLDSVIRAEESLISTQKNFVQYQASRDNMTHGLAYLYGAVSTFIME